MSNHLSAIVHCIGSDVSPLPRLIKDTPELIADLLYCRLLPCRPYDYLIENYYTTRTTLDRTYVYFSFLVIFLSFYFGSWTRAVDHYYRYTHNGLV